ncbi:MAG TPA: GNAT family N-acetyltransferase [Xanthobacteraceae bacterium]|jgi:phosphinothricin acetyltransferase
MTEIALRPATPADIPAITRIYAHAVIHGTASFELDPPDETEMTRRMQAMLSGGFPYIVAENAGALMGQAILGYAYAGPYRTRPAYRFTVEDSIYVDPNAHRRGIGRVLLACLIEESERRGFRQMLAVIGDSAQTPSIQVHRALGFRMVGSFENVGFKFGRWLDSVLMQRDLGPGATTQP